jgi:cold shock protein
MSEEVFEGEISMWRSERGFGFIRRDDGEGDIFVHVRDIAGRRYAMLALGQRVRFTVGRNVNNNRLCAKDVTPIAPIVSPLREEFQPERDELKAFAETAFLRS